MHSALCAEVLRTETHARDCSHSQVFHRSRAALDLLLLLLCLSVGDGLVKPEALNKKAIQIINRVRDKLTGE